MKRLLAILIVLTLLSSCSSSTPRSVDTNSSAKAKSAAAKGRPAPSGIKLSKIHNGMTDVEVGKIMGYPNKTSNYMTGKAWIPFYFGPDTSRTDWLYKGQGRVVFSRNHYSGGLKVIRIDYNPDELK